MEAAVSWRPWPRSGHAPARLVCGSVRDTGQGMAPDVVERIRPYFDDSPEGKAVALASRWCTALSHPRGGIAVTSAQAGTTVTVYLRSWQKRSGTDR